MSQLFAPVLLGLIPLVPARLAAQDAAEEASSPDVFEWLVERGVGLELGYIWDSSWILSGGADEGDAHRSLLDVVLAFDLDTLVGLEGGTIGLDYYSRVGENGSDYAGDLQSFSNIDEGRLDQLAELWYEQVFAHGHGRVKVGKLVANSEFAFVENGGEFLNGSFGFAPTLFTLPSYPEPASSANVFWSTDGGANVSFGLYDGSGTTGRHGLRLPGEDGDDLFLIAEVGHTVALAGAEGRVSFGVTHHDGEFGTFDGDTEDGAQGYYGLWDQRLRTGSAGDGVGDLDGFVQLSHAPEALSEVAWHLGAGTTWRGPLAARPDDLVGFATSWAFVSDEADFGRPFELAIESFWRFELSSHLSLKPDVQYIVNPGASDDLDDAVVATVRIEVSF